MAANAWRALQKQLIDYENDIADIKLKETEASRPVYLIKFFPPSVTVICPKCGHHWYDVRDDKESKQADRESKRIDREKKERGEEWSPFYTKDCEEQSTFDDFKYERDGFDDKKEDEDTEK